MSFALNAFNIFADTTAAYHTTDNVDSPLPILIRQDR